MEFCQNLCKKYNWKYLMALGLLSVIFAVVNNLRQPPERKVEWIGGQEILAKPVDEAQ